MNKAAVVGTTTWGTTLAILLAHKGVRVTLLARSQEEADRLAKAGEHRVFLPGLPFPPSLTVAAIESCALEQEQPIVLVVPSASMRDNLRALRGRLPSGALLISASKGLELGSGLRMSEVIAGELGQDLHPRLCALSGPNLAKEVAHGLPAVAVIASQDAEAAEEARELFMAPTFRVYTNPDIIGVEMGGALKNIIALGAGICDGLGYGDNAKAALVTRGLAEITRLGVALGARAATFAGLAGLGDLVTTCASPLSRNHHVGEQLARGRALGDILTSMVNVAEGVNTTRAAWEMARNLEIDMPITEQMYLVLFQGKGPRQAVTELMLREAKSELETWEA
ncbi:MAG: NAD(P)H-dependent glycerol-3-phosphate dehydrogenase [Dehalococcoidia bacterium]|nr:NAD(P)H-dependent glycerol-3-phosphate dehydrogenase [Dehalococcoidia bacterium]